jgi:3-methyladenine DNA glycosylase/8-oxoguanine DNA glycosylase
MVTEGELTLIMTRIFDKLDSFEEKIDNICDRLTRLESSVTDHYDDIEEDKERKRFKSKNNERKFYIIIAAIGTIFGIISLVK